MYGLADAPQMWQYALRWSLLQLGALTSVMDECFYFWKENGRLIGAMSTHVDDCGVTGTPSFMEWIIAALTARFGKLAEHGMPMTHVGVRHTRLKDGAIKLDQEEFLESITPIKMEKGRSTNTDAECTKEEIAELRALVGSLLYLTITRMDIMADLSTLQSAVSEAKVEHLLLGNRVLNRAKRDKDRGLVFKPLSYPLKIQVITDASFATKRTAYALLGVLVMITSESCDAKAPRGTAHIIHGSGGRAKRISHSTSHAESLAMYTGISIAESLAMRFTELFAPHGVTINHSELLKIEDEGKYDVPIDCASDCADMIQLVKGDKGVPQDRSQRLLILSLREKMFCGTVRSMHHIPTTRNPANNLTKYDSKDESLARLLVSGAL
eukprot:2267140-Amphidinium_carterae.1